jgi:hypothetical protein
MIRYFTGTAFGDNSDEGGLPDSDKEDIDTDRWHVEDSAATSWSQVHIL